MRKTKLIKEGGENKMLLDRLCDKAEAAKLLGVSQGTINRWVMDKEIPYIKMKHRVKFDLRDLDAWLKSQKVSVVEKVSKDNTVVRSIAQ